jgi:HD-GYP domain-containing protein (c-di-GMP phosphodiesterase class II)
VKFSDLPKKPGDPKSPAAPLSPIEMLNQREGASSPAAPAPRAPEPPKAVPRPPAASSPAEESEDEFERKVRQEALQGTEVYSEAVTAARQIHKALEKPLEAGNLEVPDALIRKLIGIVRSDNQEILTLADRSAPDNYLYGHVVNVAVFTLRLGATMGLPDDEMRLLGIGAFLHDIGMVSHLELVLRPTRLTEDELKRIQKHSEEGVKLLSLFPSIQGRDLEVISSIVGQVHERMEGMGYPQALGQKDIHRFAKIVGVCDMYESLTHMRAWRSRLLPHHVLRVMIEEHERTFEPGLVKSLVEALSLYPPGSFVRLSSGDVGRVVAVNQGLPTRPKVKVLVDAQGQRLPSPKVINMATHPVLYISDAVDETKLPTSDQRLLLELRAQRWWVRGF